MSLRNRSPRRRVSLRSASNSSPNRKSRWFQIGLLFALGTLAVALGYMKSISFDRSVHASTTAAFTPGNLVVYRVGSGSGSLLNTGNPVFLDEYTPTGTLVQSIALPTTDSVPNQSLVANGTSTSEGLLTRSTDGQYLVLTGYDVTPPHSGAVSSATSAAVNRVIGRVDAAGTINTTTALSDAFSGGNIRSAVSTDGNTFWATGSVDGVRTTTLGSTTSTVIASGVTNLRQVNIFGGQLYVSSGSGSTRIATVGTGTPTTTGQTITNIPGFPTTAGTSPYGFFFADLDAGVAGVDTLYVSDDSALALRKYSLVAGSWTLNGTVGVDADDYRGLTATVSGTTVTLYATRLGSSDADGGGQLISLVDATGYNGAFSGSPTLLATAGVNTALRGVALVPTASVTPTINVGDVTQVETDAGTTTFTFTVSLTSPAPAGGVTFDIATADGTAQDDNPVTEDNDYVAKSETGRTISEGNTSATFTVTVNGDATDEPNETFFVNISNVTGATLGDGQGLGTISNDDGPPALSINDVSQAEGNAGTTNFTFTVSLNKPAQAGGVSFTINTADGTAQDDNPATEDNDYVAIAGGAGNITAGNTSTNVTVQVNGDATTEPNETFFVNLSSITGATVTDSQGLGTIQNDDVSVTPIHSIQGSGMSSPFTGNIVTTTGIVTGRKTNGFFIQDPNPDSDANTSEGMFVFTSSAPPASAAVGNSVQVTGTVTEFESATTDEPDGIAPPDPKTATELITPTVVLLSSGNPLPAAIDAVAAGIFVSGATSRGAQLEKYEYMRLSVSSLTVSQPTNNNFGEFWGVVTGTGRPFREPGIEAGDPVPAADQGPHVGTSPPSVPIFDGNFERILVDSDDATVGITTTRRAALFVTTGAVVTGLVGPLDYAFDAYRIVLDETAVTNVTPGITAAVPVPTPTTQEFTIGHTNLENFSSGNATKLNKASLAIRNVLRNPDILGLIEVDTAASATALANKVNADAADPVNVNYVAYFNDTAASQDIGYLVNSARVTVVGSPAVYHAGTTFTYCGVTDLLHDRPTFILTATVPRAGGGTVPVTVMLNHTKSLIATDSPRSFGSCGTGTEGARNREKRRLQAEDIADLIASRMTENLVILGDLNAFDFNDGLTDVVGTLKGIPVAANQVVEPSTPDRWPYVLTNLISTLSSAQQYSFAFEGNAQALDHVLVNQPMVNRFSRYAYGRFNGDFSNDYATDANRPERVADHDAPVAYFGNQPTAANGTIEGRLTDSQGAPLAGAVVNLSGTQNRKFITNANGEYRFENVETTGFYTIKPALANFEFSPAERFFSLIGNNTSASFTGARVANDLNAIDTPEYFVRQHYLDFLGREPDENGFNFWSDQILECGNDAGCAERRAINVSAAYFLSIEFAKTGGLVDGVYRASFARAPKFAEFMPDSRSISDGVFVGQPDWEAKMAANSQAFVASFMQRAAFRNAFDGLTNVGYVDALINHTGVAYSQAERDVLINGLADNSLSRADVLLRLAEDQRFVDAKRNEMFVMMEYFGYLRRDPDPDGFSFWLRKLNEFEGNFERAEMVKAFIRSGEYRSRFAQ